MKLSHSGHLVMLAKGIGLGRNAQLSRVSAETGIQAKDKSNEVQLRRWVKHGRIDVEAINLPFLGRQFLEALSMAPLILVMDGSQVRRGCMVCVLS